MTTDTAQKPKSQRIVKKIPLRLEAKKGSLAHQLESIKNQSKTKIEFIETAAQEIAETFDSIFALLEFESGGRVITREFIKNDISTEQLVLVASDLAIESQVDGQLHCKMIDTFLIMTCPLTDSDETSCGAFTLYVPCESTKLKDNLTQSFQKTVRWVLEASREYRSNERSIEPDNKNLIGIQKASKFENLTHLCYGLVNNYAEKLGCERSIIGLLDKDGQQIEIIAVSGSDQIQKNSPKVIQIKQAQEECLDFAKPVFLNAEGKLNDSPRTRLLIHQQWHQKSAGASVASIPIQDANNQTIGVLSLQRVAEHPFDSDEIEKVANSVSGFAASIQLMRFAHRSLKTHLRESVVKRLPSQFKKPLTRKVLLAACAFLLFGWFPYQPTVTCIIEPDQMSRLVAPFDGVLASVQHLPGDQVSRGDVVFGFDTSQLESEQSSILAQIKSKQVQRDQALRARETAIAKILDAEVHALESQLAVNERKIERSNLRSSLDGHLVRGDLRAEIGQTIPRGTALAEIAPETGMKLRLQIPETKATHIKVGDSGYFVAESQPSEKHAFEIVRITPSTEIVDSKNVIVAEAIVDGSSDWMRSGMQGYACVNTGWTPVIWIFGHKIWDSLRLGFWL